MNEVKNVKKELSDISIITMAPGYTVKNKQRRKRQN